MQYQDGRGVSFTASSQTTVDSFEPALNNLLGTFGDPEAAINLVLEKDDDFILGHCFSAYLNLLALERGLMPTVATIIEKLKTLYASAGDHEKEHIYAIRLWHSGDLHGAVKHWERALLLNPCDLLAMRLCHDLAFFLGDCRNLRDTVGRVRNEWSRDMPGFGYLLGMHAFGLEECGDYQRAEETGRDALEMNPKDSWAVHAVAHVKEMTGRQADGINWLTSREPDWAYDGNFFAIHNWWHLALYHLDLKQYARVIELYDGPIRNEKTTSVLDLVDAASLLWRMFLLGEQVGTERWEDVANGWSIYADDNIYAFNDLHAIMSLSATERFTEADNLINSLEKQAEGSTTTNQLALQGIGLGACRGFLSFAKGQYADSVEHLLPVRNKAFHFGGSHAQRDIMSWTLIEAMLRAGQYNRARTLVNERLELNPSSPQCWAMASRAYSGLGLSSKAATANAKAEQLIS